MLNSFIVKEPKSIRDTFFNLFEHLGLFLFILFIPLTAIFVMGIAFIAGIFTKGLVR